METKKKTLEKIREIDFNKIFVIDENMHLEYTYGEFFSGCIALANSLNECSQKNIFVVMDNSVELAALYFAVVLANKRIIVADPEKGVDEIQELLREQKNVFSIIKKNGIEVNSDFTDIFQRRYEKNIKEKFIKALEDYDFSCGYLTTFTSGTSGKTKGVINSLNNLFETTFSFAEKVHNLNGGTFLHLMPMTYMAGILNSIFMPFILEYRIVIGSRFSVRLAMSFWKIVEKYEVNFLWMSPMMLTMVDKVDRGDKYEKYCRNHIISYFIGTAPLSNDVRKKFEERYGVKLQASYGLSETLFISVETMESILKKKVDNVGELISNVDYIVNEDGELQIKVPWMFNGYTNVDTSEYFNGDYYMTGDLAEIKDGILSIVGRKKDLIIRGGMNISPKLIEEYIAEMNVFLEFCIYGKKNDYGEEEVCCAYVLSEKQNHKDVEKAVSRNIIKKLGNNYLINSFNKVDNLPRNINGKIDKNALRGE